MAYIRKHPAPLINDDGFDFENARIEWQILSLWDELPDCLKSRQVIDEVLQLVQSSPDLIVKMNLRG
jgi:hypothetical protein